MNDDSDPDSTDYPPVEDLTIMVASSPTSNTAVARENVFEQEANVAESARLSAIGERWRVGIRFACFIAWANV
jgi:hypothetical protein